MTRTGLYFLKAQTHLSKWTGSATIRRLCISSSLIGAQSIAMVPKIYVVSLGISKAPCSASCFINSMSSASSIWLFKRVCRGKSKDSRVYKSEWRRKGTFVKANVQIDFNYSSSITYITITEIWWLNEWYHASNIVNHQQMAVLICYLASSFYLAENCCEKRLCCYFCEMGP